MGQLRDRMDADLRLRGLSENTRRLYLRCARDFTAYCGRSPAVVGTEEVRAFLRHLVDTRRAPSTCGVYAAALRFLYDVTLDRPAVAARIPRRRVPERLPVILSVTEVAHLLAAVHAPKHRAILMTAYGTGLRLSEILALQTTDIDGERLRIRVRAGKGGRDRDVPLSARLLTVLRTYWQQARRRLHPARRAAGARAPQPPAPLRAPLRGGLPDLAHARPRWPPPRRDARHHGGAPHLDSRAPVPSPRPLSRHRRWLGRRAAAVDRGAPPLSPPGHRALPALPREVPGGARAGRERGDLHFPAPITDLAAAAAFGALLDDLYRQEWVVYAKPPFGGPTQVFHYLGRYTHRVGLSNHRLQAITPDAVRFATKDGHSVTLPPHEFLRRFLLHVLPAGFVKIRHFGLFAARRVPTALAHARHLLAGATPRTTTPPAPSDWRTLLRRLTGVDLARCPRCAHGTMIRHPLPDGAPVYAPP